MRRFFFILCIFFLSSGSAASKTPSKEENLPIPAAEFLSLLKHADFEILSVKGTQHGMTGATKWTVAFENGPKDIEIKWKPAPKVSGEGWNNTPRREVAAYQVQELFLDPDDYVVPPVASRCIPLDRYSKVKANAKPNLHSGFQCVFGVVSAWLKNVELVRPVFDPKRFEADPRYAYHMANANLLCYLINHQDTVDDNFLISTSKENPKVFSIDNGISFRWEFHNFFMDHLNVIRVPALPKKSIDRLRGVKEEDLEKLKVVEQLDVDEKDILRQVTPGEVFRPSLGSRVSSDTIQLGLTPFEISKVRERIQKLLKAVDEGKYRLF